MALFRPSRHTAPPPAPLSIAGMRLLLVEDNDMNQLVASELLGHVAGAQITIASTGEEALQQLRTQDFDAVLMDIQMPGMDGYETTAQIRAEPRWRELPIIAMTAHAMQQERDRCLAAGMNGVASKPFDFEALCATLASWRRNAPAHASGPARLPGLDGEIGLRHSGGSGGRYERVLRRFLESQSGAWDALGQALAVGDLATAERLAHTLKSNAGTVGATSLARAAQEVEERLRSARSSRATVTLDDPVLQGLQAPLDEVIGGLRARFASQAHGGGAG